MKRLLWVCYVCIFNSQTHNNFVYPSISSSTSLHFFFILAKWITPLVCNPGRIMLTSSRLYFQPFNNADPVSMSFHQIRSRERAKYKTVIHFYQCPGLQQSEYGQRHFTGFLCCLRPSHAPYADGQIMLGVFQHSYLSKSNKLFLQWNNKSLILLFYSHNTHRHFAHCLYFSSPLQGSEKYYSTRKISAHIICKTIE